MHGSPTSRLHPLGVLHSGTGSVPAPPPSMDPSRGGAVEEPGFGFRGGAPVVLLFVRSISFQFYKPSPLAAPRASESERPLDIPPLGCDLMQQGEGHRLKGPERAAPCAPPALDRRQQRGVGCIPGDPPLL